MDRFKMRHVVRWGVLLLTLALGSYACQKTEVPANVSRKAPDQVPAPAPVPDQAPARVHEITVQQLRDVLQKDPGVMLVEVRTQPEWEKVRAPGIKKFIPYDEMAQRHEELGVDHDTPIYVICRSGNRSGKASRTLVGLGYKNVYNVAGGTLAWTAAGFPTESGPVPSDSN